MLYMLGLLSLTFSILFLFFPEVLLKLSEWGNRLVFTDHSAVLHRKVVGTVLFIAGLFMFFISWKY